MTAYFFILTGSKDSSVITMTRLFLLMFFIMHCSIVDTLPEKTFDRNFCWYNVVLSDLCSNKCQNKIAVAFVYSFRSGEIYYVFLVFIDFYFSCTFFSSIQSFPNMWNMSLLLYIIVTYIKEYIITKLQKLYSPPRNSSTGNKS